MDDEDMKGELDKATHLHILKEHSDYAVNLQKVFNLMTIQGEYSVIGSGAIEEVKYKGDYDLQNFPLLKDPYKAASRLLKVFQEKFKTAESNPNLFITDLKMGEDFKKYAEPIRWNKKTIVDGVQIVDGVKVTFEDAVLMKSKSNKIDMVELHDGVFTEFSENYYITCGTFSSFAKTAWPDILFAMRRDAYVKYIHGDIWKATKRCLSFMKGQSGFIPQIQSLLSLFNSETGKISKFRAQVDTLGMLCENKFRTPKKSDIIKNLKIIQTKLSECKEHKLDINGMVETIEGLELNKMPPKLEELLVYLKAVCNKDAEAFIKNPGNEIIYNYITNPIYNIEQGTIAPTVPSIKIKERNVIKNPRTNTQRRGPTLNKYVKRTRSLKPRRIQTEKDNYINPSGFLRF